MKRLVPAILALAIFAGIFAPVTASLSRAGSLALGAPYAYAVGGPDSPTPPPSGDKTPSPADATVGSSTTAGGGKTDVSAQIGSCGVIFGQFSNCIVWIFYFIPYSVGAWVMHFSAWVFDSLAALTLSSVIYSGASFINDGWRLTRDFSNIFLILILLFTALSFVLGLEIGHANPKKMLVSVIFIAIIINFSMFMTEVVIDTSNSLALVFYNQITITNKNGPTGGADASTIPSGTVPPKTISAALVAAFEPAELQSQDFWDGIRGGRVRQNTHITAGAVTGAAIGSVVPVIGTTIGAIVGGIAGYFITTNTNEIPASVLIGILILVGVMYGVVAYSFFIASLSFVGRLVGLWIAIIFAPLAFISYIIPSTRTIKGFGWTEWWKDLLALSFSAPIYFFFLLLISLMTKSTQVAGFFLHQGTSFEILVVIFISFMFLIIMLLKATKYVKSASGELGEMVFKGAALVGGLVGGVALGAVAFGGRRMAGSYFKGQVTNDNLDLAAGVVNNSTLNALSSKFSHLTPDVLKNMKPEEIRNLKEFQGMQRDAERKIKSAQFFAKSSFDVRQTAAGNAFSKATGVNLESFGGLSTEKAAGGYEGEMARIATKQRAFTELLGHHHGQQDAFDDVTEKRDVITENEESAKTAAETANKLVEAGKEFKDIVKDLEKLKEERADARSIKDQGAQEAALKSVKDKIDLKEAEFMKLKDKKINGASYNDREKEIQQHRKKIEEQRTGEKDKDGNPMKYELKDVNVARKADGDLVSERDVELGVIKTESRSMAEIKALKERNKTNREKSYGNMKMNQSDFAVEHQVFDQYGQVKRMGHINFNQQNTQAMKGWAKEAWKINASNLMNNTKSMKTLVGGLYDVFRYGALGAIQETVRAVRHNDVNMGSRRLEARATQVAVDKDHKIHEFKSKYQAAETGFSNFLKALTGGNKSGGNEGSAGATAHH